MKPFDPDPRDEALEAHLRRELSSAPDLTPSAAFAGSVMRAVRAEAALASAPHALEFPWGRLLPGLILSLGLTGFVLSRLPWGEAADSAGLALDRVTELTGRLPETPWIAPTLVAALWVAFGLLLAVAAVKAATLPRTARLEIR